MENKLLKSNTEKTKPKVSSKIHSHKDVEDEKHFLIDYNIRKKI